MGPAGGEVATAVPESKGAAEGVTVRAGAEVDAAGVDSTEAAGAEADGEVAALETVCDSALGSGFVVPPEGAGETLAYWAASARLPVRTSNVNR